jgi:hypothetical protein
MDTNKQCQPLPAPTRQRLGVWMQQRQQLTELINATVAASREALDVPPHWVINDVNEGFIDPATLQGDSAEQPAEEEGIKG